MDASQSTRLSKVLCIFQTNIIAFILPQPRQKMVLTFHLPHFADTPVIITYTHLLESQADLADFWKFIHAANKCSLSAMLLWPNDSQQGCRVIKAGLHLQRERDG